MALSRFMPYGAPDLLADQDERMLRATMSSIALIGVIFACAGFLLAHLPRTIEIVPDMPDYQLVPTPMLPPPSVLPPTLTPIAPSSPNIPHAIPQPVPDALAPTLDPAPAPSGAAAPSAQGSGTADPSAVQPAPDPDALPGYNDFVYVEELPELIRATPPVYPDMAREAGVDGTVVVRMLIGRDGLVKDARVEARHSVPMLDEAALASARSSVFKPALSNGHPVAVWVSRPYRFSLH